MHLTFTRKSTGLLSALLASIALAACASPGVAPTVQMTEARSSLSQAESAGAREAAPVELAMARDKFAKAEAAVRDEHFVMARRLSEEAQVDAELAERKARAAKASDAAAELARSNQLLRDELDRKAPR